jgi:hypothetical protein
MQVDWVYYSKDAIISRADVLAKVNNFRSSGILRKNLSGQTEGGTVNPPPTVSITSPANSSTVAGPTNITINATASDSNGSIASVAFYSGTQLLSTDNTSPYSFVWNNVLAGTYTIRANATDNGGATSTAQVSITVTGNTPPVVNITAPANNAILFAPANINITATASDANGTITNVTFFNGTQQLGIDNSSPYSFVWNNVAVGNYTIRAIATDNQGATANSQVTISVVANVPPVVNITAPANNATLMAPANITISATATDQNGTVSSVTFFNGTQQLGVDNSSPYSFALNNVAAGIYTLRAVATDNQGATATSQITVNVVSNIPPGVSITSPVNNASFNAPATIMLRATASDQNGSITSVTFYRGTTQLNVDNTSPYEFNWTNVPAGTYSITAVARDNQNATTTSSPVSISVVTQTPVQLSVVYKTIVSWNSGFQGEVRITNNSSTHASSWSVQFDCPHNITPIWDAVITSHVGTRYEIKGTGGTTSIPANQSVVFGFIGNIAAGQTFTPPYNVSVQGTGQSGRLSTTSLEQQEDLELSVTSYPNPFNDVLTIEFTLPEESRVELDVFDMNGAELSTLLNKNLPAGKHSATWVATSFPQGMFFYRLRNNKKAIRGIVIKK